MYKHTCKPNFPNSAHNEMLVKLPETLQASQGQQENGAYETIHALGVYY